ncbi:MAG: hypothetical protein IJU20_07990 [Clostridia bacterium]|nr:hypothetical protein [Clostridia bacterium]
MDKLKPCPKCGDAWIYAVVGDWPSGYELHGYRLNCKCGWAWQTLVEWFPSKEQAKEAWNRRADTPHKCGDCEDFHICEDYVEPSETFPEVGGCPAFKTKEESNDKP